MNRRTRQKFLNKFLDRYVLLLLKRTGPKNDTEKEVRSSGYITGKNNITIQETKTERYFRLRWPTLVRNTTGNKSVFTRYI